MGLVPQEVSAILTEIGKLAELIKTTNLTADKVDIRTRLIGIGLALLEPRLVILISQWIGHYCGLKLSTRQTFLTSKYSWGVTYQPRFETAIQSAEQNGIPQSFFQALADLTLELHEQDRQLCAQPPPVEIPQPVLDIVGELEKMRPGLPNPNKGKRLRDFMSSLLYQPNEIPMAFARELRSDHEFIVAYIGGNPLYIGKTMTQIVRLFGDPIAEEWDPDTETFKASWPIARLAEAKRKQAPHAASPWASPN